LFSTDAGGPISGHLPIRCSTDKVNWQLCGAVFSQILHGYKLQFPELAGCGPRTLRFSTASTIFITQDLFSRPTPQRSVWQRIPPLDPSDPAYQWVDEGEVLSSSSPDDFNAIDPNILVDSDGSI
jgi:arabinan endo-1,5-alpha-L-arabinosidase